MLASLCNKFKCLELSYGYTNLFCFHAFQRFKGKNTSIAYIFKLKMIFWHIFYICEPIFKFLAAFIKTIGKQ